MISFINRSFLTISVASLPPFSLLFGSLLLLLSRPLLFALVLLWLPLGPVLLLPSLLVRSLSPLHLVRLHLQVALNPGQEVLAEPGPKHVLGFGVDADLVDFDL